MRSALFHGDNLGVLRRHVGAASVDLAYLDPPFNSNRDYLAREEGDGLGGGAKVPAFADTWSWDGEAQRRLEEVVAGGGRAADLLEGLRRFLGDGPMLAYLVGMAPCLAEVRRALKPTGSAYLHCDPTASHPLKLLMDAVFGPENFRSEVVWRRSSAHNRARRFGPVHDVILHYARSAPDMVWHTVYVPYAQEYADATYRRREPDGRRYRTVDLTANNPGFTYEWKGRRPAQGRYWAYNEDSMRRLDAEGRIHYTSAGTPQLKRYLDEMKGVPVQDVWTDIPPLPGGSAQRVGYPTQKPEALLERILRASSDEGHVVLDPFCGSGTALAVAQRLGRRWVGIDSSPVAIAHVRRRLAAIPGADYDFHGEAAVAVEGSAGPSAPHSPASTQA